MKSGLWLPRLVDPQAGEAEFERWLVRAADATGWCGYHVRISEAVVTGVHNRTHHGHADAIGFPDWILAKPGQPLLILELKGVSGHTDRDQERWLDLLDRTKGPPHARAAWPRHAGEIAELLVA